MRVALLAVALALAAASTAACGRGDEPRPAAAQARAPAPEPVTPAPAPPAPPSAAAPTVVFHPDGRPPARVTVDVAISPREIQRGLMYREHLPPDRGMIFLFRTSKVQRFWMKNTLVPLDMIFVADDLTVAGVVADTVPRSLESRGVDRPSRYVVEVNAGWARAHGVEAGTRVTFEGVPVERAVVDD